MFASAPWQPSLLEAADDGPEPDRSFAGLVRHELEGGAWVDHQPGWLRGADAVFDELLAGASFEQREMTIFGNRVEQPRLSAWWPAPERPSERGTGPERPSERATGPERPSERGTEQPERHAPAVVETMRLLLGDRYREDFDSVGMNLYRDGRDSVAWHADRHARQADSPDVVVAIVSVGEARRFLLRRRFEKGSSLGFDLGHGDLLVMGGSCQRTWQHTVPKVARPVGPRLSITYRHVPPPLPA